MRRLLNTLFVTSEDAYLALDGENIVVRRDREELGRFPLHNFEEIVCFSYAGASPALMGACVKRSIGLELLHTGWAISGPGGWDHQWQRAAAPGAVPRWRMIWLPAAGSRNI